jgi:hypothetical protein
MSDGARTPPFFPTSSVENTPLRAPSLEIPEELKDFQPQRRFIGASPVSNVAVPGNFNFRRQMELLLRTRNIREFDLVVQRNAEIRSVQSL